MKRGAKPINIVLGEAIVKIDDKMIGLTKDGAKFTVENTYRAIEADGDRRKVEGRISKDSGIPKIEINHLELLTMINAIHPSISVDTKNVEGYTVIRGTGKIDDENDYHKIEIIGSTKDGREVSCMIEKAINLENIEWEFKDKNEVIDKATFEGVEEEESEGLDEGWEVKFKNEVK